MAIQEDSIKMAEELKQIILDFPDLRSLTQKVFEWHKLKKYLKHNCEQSDLTAVGHTLHRGKFSCGVDRPLLSGTFKCKFCNFEEKVTLRANGSIESKTRYSKTDESPLEMATGGKDTSNSVLNSTSSKKKSNLVGLLQTMHPTFQRYVNWSFPLFWSKRLCETQRIAGSHEPRVK